MSGGFSNKGPGGQQQLTSDEVLWTQTGESGVLLLVEGAAPSNTSGVGKIYVKSSDSKLYYKNDSGVETEITGGSGSGTGLTWSEVTGTSQSAAVNNAYICNNAGLVTVTLPDTAAVGDIVRVVGKGAGGWSVAQNASEIIHFGNLDSTTGVGGSISSTHRRDAVELVCVVANTEWNVISSHGNITVV